MSWQYAYDGLDPPPEALEEPTENLAQTNDKTDNAQISSRDSNGAISSLSNPSESTPASSGYTSLAVFSSSPASTGPVSLTAEEDQEFWQMMKDPSISDSVMGGYGGLTTNL